MRRKLLTALPLVALMASCGEKDHDLGGQQNPFAGKYSPSHRIVLMRHDINEFSEIGERDYTVFDSWQWNSDGTLARVDYDIDGTGLQNDGRPASAENKNDDTYETSFSYDIYHYNADGQLGSIVHHPSYDNDNEYRTYLFHYSDGLLRRISYAVQGDEEKVHVTEFLYHPNQQQPYEIMSVDPLEEWQWTTYHTDTLVQRWTLLWENGNLMRVTADSTACYVTGVARTDYFYDDKPNPMKGFFRAENIAQIFLDNPSCFNSNNLIRHVRYDKEDHDIMQQSYSYQYQRDGYPCTISYRYNYLYFFAFIDGRTSITYAN